MARTKHAVSLSKVTVDKKGRVVIAHARLAAAVKKAKSVTPPKGQKAARAEFDIWS